MLKKTKCLPEGHLWTGPGANSPCCEPLECDYSGSGKAYEGDMQFRCEHHREERAEEPEFEGRFEDMSD